MSQGFASDVYGHGMTQRQAQVAIRAARGQATVASRRDVAVGRIVQDRAQGIVRVVDELVAGFARGVFCGCAPFHRCACHDTSDLPFGSRRQHDLESCQWAHDTGRR